MRLGTAKHRRVGISLSRSDNNTVRHLTAGNRSPGIEVGNSSWNLLEGNVVSGGNRGIGLWGTSGNNTIRGNDASGNPVGIRDYYGSGINNRYIDNDLSNCGTAVSIAGNGHAFEMFGNKFTNSQPLSLRDVHGTAESSVSLIRSATMEINANDARAESVSGRELRVDRRFRPLRRALGRMGPGNRRVSLKRRKNTQHRRQDATLVCSLRTPVGLRSTRSMRRGMATRRQGRNRHAEERQ